MAAFIISCAATESGTPLSYNSRLQQTESYESAGNQLGGILFVSCPNWGVNSNAGLYDMCPHASQTNDNGNLQSYSEFNNGVGWFSQSVPMTA